MNLFTFLHFTIVLTFVFALVFTAIRILHPVALKIGWLDIPNQRKQHTGKIPLTGGVAMYCGFFVATLLLFPIDKNTIFLLLTSLSIMLTGVMDDINDLSVSTRILVQSLAALVLTFGTSLYLHSFGDLFGTGLVDLGIFGYPVSVIAVVACINAFNMVDGIDGLAGILANVSFTSLVVLFFLNNDSYGYLLSLIFVTILLPFLQSNLKKSSLKGKIFMGDAGAMFIGFSVVWLLTYGTQSDAPSFRPVTALWVIALPLMDIVAVMVHRIKNGQTPVQAGRDHLHHILMDAGFSTRQVLFIISIMALLFASVGVISDVLAVKENIMFFAFMLLFFTYNYFIRWLTRFC